VRGGPPSEDEDVVKDEEEKEVYWFDMVVLDWVKCCGLSRSASACFTRI